MSAFLLFSQAKRAEMKEQHPDWPITQIAKGLGVAWRIASEKDKKPFDKKAKALKKEYLKKKERYDKEKAKTARPKRPMSAFLLFSQEKRNGVKEANPEMKITDVSKELGKMWRAENDHSKWEAKAGKLKAKYAKALEKWKAKQEEEA